MYIHKDIDVNALRSIDIYTYTHIFILQVGDIHTRLGNIHGDFGDYIGQMLSTILLIWGVILVTILVVLSTMVSTIVLIWGGNFVNNFVKFVHIFQQVTKFC